MVDRQNQGKGGGGRTLKPKAEIRIPKESRMSTEGGKWDYETTDYGLREEAGGRGERDPPKANHINRCGAIGGPARPGLSCARWPFARPADFLCRHPCPPSFLTPFLTRKKWARARVIAAFFCIGPAPVFYSQPVETALGIKPRAQNPSDLER
jgi:hypothetical protein